MKIVSEWGNDLQEYLDRLTSRPCVTKWKLVSCALGETWCGNWIVDGDPSFLVLLCRETELKLVPKGTRKKKKKYETEWLDTYRIWCCGNDDTYMEKWHMSFEEASELFGLITIDGTSRKEMEAFGLHY